MTHRPPDRTRRLTAIAFLLVAVLYLLDWLYSGLLQGAGLLGAPAKTQALKALGLATIGVVLLLVPGRGSARHEP